MSSSRSARRIRLGAILVTMVALGALAPSEIAAHFYMEEPTSWREQNTLGDPQKTGPCGDEGSAASTGAITAYQRGQTITIRIRETIFHPGHYRVALAVSDRSELPAPPPVTPGSTDCGSVPIMDPPVFPVLADGVLPHTSPLSGEQTIEVTLPPDVTCDHCTLQVVQWMSNHGAPCFYYHCADIAIHDVVVDAGTDADASMSLPDASAPGDAGDVASDAGGGAAVDAGEPEVVSGSSCGCAVPGRGGAGRGGLALVLALALGVVWRRRR